jgi:hypothetical protein
VLVAAAFSMFNRYVDGLTANTPTDPAVYQVIGEARNGRLSTRAALVHRVGLATDRA